MAFMLPNRSVAQDIPCTLLAGRHLIAVNTIILGNLFVIEDGIYTHMVNTAISVGINLSVMAVPTLPTYTSIDTSRVNFLQDIERTTRINLILHLK
jgi:hypothetical protein